MPNVLVREQIEFAELTPSFADVRIAAAPFPLPTALRTLLKTQLADLQTKVGVPTTAPTAMIEQTNRLQHTIHFANSTTPTSKAKPAGVRGCQIWVKIGTAPPVSASDLQDLATDTRTPYVAGFDQVDAIKTADDWLRWENTKGETGPWSAVMSATITG